MGDIMKQFVIEFEDEDIEMMEDQLQQLQDAGEMHTMEDYIYYATMTHCKTMKAAAQFMHQAGGLDQLMSDDNIHVGVLNMPVQLANPEDKEEFSQFLNEAINDAVHEFNNRNNGQLN